MLVLMADITTICQRWSNCCELWIRIEKHCSRFIVVCKFSLALHTYTLDGVYIVQWILSMVIIHQRVRLNFISNTNTMFVPNVFSNSNQFFWHMNAECLSLNSHTFICSAQWFWTCFVHNVACVLAAHCSMLNCTIGGEWIAGWCIFRRIDILNDTNNCPK